MPQDASTETTRQTAADAERRGEPAFLLSGGRWAGLRRWQLITMPARNGPITSRSEPQVKNTAKASKTIRANKRKARLKAKHRRQRSRATA